MSTRGDADSESLLFLLLGTNHNFLGFSCSYTYFSSNRLSGEGLQKRLCTFSSFLQHFEFSFGCDLRSFSLQTWSVMLFSFLTSVTITKKNSGVLLHHQTQGALVQTQPLKSEKAFTFHSQQKELSFSALFREVEKWQPTAVTVLTAGVNGREFISVDEGTET